MEKLQFRLRDIPDSGLDLDTEIDRPLMAEVLEGIEGGDPDQSSAHATLHVTRERDNVFVRGQIRGLLTVGCVRCLEAARVNVTAPVVLTIVPAGTALPDAEADEAAVLDDIEFSTYEGDEIDLNDMVREQLVLSIPIAPVCAEACKGLCAKCGKDLNKGSCDCPPEERQSPFAALKSLKFE